MEKLNLNFNDEKNKLIDQSKCYTNIPALPIVDKEILPPLSIEDENKRLTLENLKLKLMMDKIKKIIKS